MLITPTSLPLPFTNSGYLLIEPSNLAEDLKKVLPSTYACVPPFLWAAEDSMPCLLRLDKLTLTEQDMVSQLLDQETSEQYSPVVCAWLQSDKNTEELASYIARLISGYVPNEGQVIWRYYDPRVFILAAHLFTEEKGNALLGAIECWTFPWRRQWWCIQRTQPLSCSNADLELGWPDNTQWKLINKSRVFYRLHARLNERRTLPAQCLDDLNHSIAAFLETENYLHFDNDEDRAEFSYLSTLYRSSFRENYEFISRWTQLKRQEITLKQMLSSIGSEDIEFMENISFIRRPE